MYLVLNSYKVYNAIITEFLKDVKKNMKLKKVCLLLSHERWLTGLEKMIEKLRACGVSCEARLAEEGYKPEAATLYLTDCASAVSKLQRAGLPVLAYLHEENRDADFSEAGYACEKPEEVEPQYLERVYRRFMGLPWEILETERCILRESVEEDVEAFGKIYAEPCITKYIEALYDSKVSQRAYIREYREKVYAYYEFGIWTVILKETGEVIGRAGLSVREGYALPELGYVIGVPWQGKGLAREVCQGILQYAWEEFGFDRVQALIHQENAASLRLAAALGFEKQKQTGNNLVIFVRSKQ